MYCKTYSGDFDRFSNLVDSFHKYNEDNILLYVSAPEKELHLFKKFSCSSIEVISDESFAKSDLASEGHKGINVGYINQEICKLTFYKTRTTKNYLCLDSDSYFIRNFYVSDFMHDDDTPYTVLVMDKDLSIERHYRDVHWVGRQAAIKKIYEYVGLNDRRLRACHNAQVFNVKVLESLAHDFMKSKNLNYIDLLKIAPYEFSWYNVWFQKTGIVKEFAVEPFFKMLHMRQEYEFSRLRLLREEDFAQSYVGLVLNSKWRPRTPLKYENPDGWFFRLFYKFVTGDSMISKLYYKLSSGNVFLRIYRNLLRSIKS